MKVESPSTRKLISFCNYVAACIDNSLHRCIKTITVDDDQGFVWSLRLYIYSARKALSCVSLYCSPQSVYFQPNDLA